MTRPSSVGRICLSCIISASLSSFAIICRRFLFSFFQFFFLGKRGHFPGGTVERLLSADGISGLTFLRRVSASTTFVTFSDSRQFYPLGYLNSYIWLLTMTKVYATTLKSNLQEEFTVPRELVFCPVNLWDTLEFKLRNVP